MGNKERNSAKSVKPRAHSDIIKQSAIASNPSPELTENEKNMYVVEIVNNKTHRTVGKPIFTGAEYGLPRLQDGCDEARKRLRELGLSEDDHTINYRIVGCL